MREKFDNFRKALLRLEEALQLEPTSINMDATIQRFEFTYELAWNVIRKFLLQFGIEGFTARECFKGAYKFGLIKVEDEEIWLEMIGDRNLTSHIYNEKVAQRIYQNIKDEYFKQFKLLKDELETRV